MYLFMSLFKDPMTGNGSRNSFIFILLTVNLYATSFEGPNVDRRVGTHWQEDGYTNSFILTVNLYAIKYFNDVWSIMY